MITIKYSEDGCLAHCLLHYRGVDFWSVISPSDVNSKRGGCSIQQVAERRNQSAKHTIDRHFVMCEMFSTIQNRFEPFQGEYIEGTPQFGDKQYFGITVSMTRHNELWRKIPDFSLAEYAEQLRQYMGKIKGRVN